MCIMETLLTQIAAKISVSDELKKAIESNFTTITLAKKETLIKEGQYCKQLFFMNKGMVRFFHLDKGKDITSWFYKDEQFFTSWYSFYGNQASFETIEAISDCELYAISKPNFDALIKQFNEFSDFARQLAEEQLTAWDFYFKGYMHMSAREKYNLLLSYFPDIELRMKLGQIASMLGISQETLSRIRAGN